MSDKEAGEADIVAAADTLENKFLHCGKLFAKH